jgi:protein gp37
MFDLPVMNQIPLDGEPLVYFVCSLSDIGHPAIPMRYVNEVFSVI